MSAVDILSVTEVEVRDALPRRCACHFGLFIHGMYFTDVRRLRKSPPPLMKCVSG
ncbi:Uncharacterised protein [Enterobacter cloacae]|uniref:Uncharacterized protein n=1 Tax=Enterobacter cloacae TaxID=550 RepID=A0A377LX22_ENTCL|nr:Uncharacterised protein [Enterobacter cloacae]